MPPRQPAPADWRALLAPLTGPGNGGAALPLAIGAELLTGFGGFGFSRFGAQSATIEDVKGGAELAVALRPLRPGSRAGTWMRGDLTWKRFRYAGTSNSGPLSEYRPDHAELLGRLTRLFLAEQPFGADPGDLLRLDEFRSPEGWALLRTALSAGVELVGLGVVDGVDIAPHARVRLDVSRGEDGLRLAPAVEVAGRARADLTAAGPGGFVAVEPGRGAGRVHLTLTPLREPVPGAIAPLLARGDTLVVPEADADEFLTDLAPQLAARLPVTSRDRSATIPAVTPPRLALTVAHAPEGGAVDLSWGWTYRAPRRTLPLRGQDTGRDLDHEAAVLARVRRIRPSAADQEHEHLTRVDAASFVEHELPRLASLPDVDVHEEGERPHYVELDGTPRLRITQVEPPAHHAHDWFGLGFEVTLGEVPVPFTAIFSALSGGRKAVLMPDRTYFRLDHPMFDRLRELLAEAELLDEWEPGAPAISRYQVDLWDEFEDLADETVEARAWRESARALRELDALEPPAPPATLSAHLRPYQLDGLAWLALLTDRGLGGILADDMGLGKTLQTLALLARARARAPQAPPFLVVAPASVLSVWRTEAERFAPTLDVRVLDTTAATRATSVAEASRGADVVVTSYGLLRLDEAELTAPEWSGLILDEAQAVKNPRSRAHRAAQAVRAPWRLAITGTPLENSLMDLWALLSLTAPGLLPSARAFREQYVRPIERPDASESGQRRAEQRMARLRRRIRPFVLRRTKELVAPELPPRQEQVLRVPLQPAHRRLYDQVLQRERQKLLGLAGDIDRHRFIVFRSLTLLRMLALDPAIVAPEHAGVASSKLEALLETLREAIDEGHRVLVFSQFTSHLDRVGARLDEHRIDHVRLDGATTGRERVVARFREGDAPVFLISLKAGGVGLTLTEADYVILLDPWWNPAAEAQAIDRAHRIGQDRAVMVYRMVAEDTIEEKVLALQERKRALFTSLTDEDEAFASALTAEELRELLG